MGDFWAESIRLASLATERFLCLLGQGKSRLSRMSEEISGRKYPEINPNDLKTQ